MFRVLASLCLLFSGLARVLLAWGKGCDSHMFLISVFFSVVAVKSSLTNIGVTVVDCEQNFECHCVRLKTCMVKMHILSHHGVSD